MPRRTRSRMNRDFLEQLERIRLEIEALAKRRGVTPTTLARLAGVQPSTVNKTLNRERPVTYLLKESTLNKLRVVAGLTRHQNGTSPEVVPRMGSAAPMVTPRAWDLPIRASRDEKGVLMFKGSGNYGFARRPGSLADVAESYAIRFVDDTNSPRYEAGWIGHVNPSMPVVVGKDFVLRLSDDSGIVGTLRQDTPTSYVLSQFNRTEQVAILKTNIKSIHRIIGSDQD